MRVTWYVIDRRERKILGAVETPKGRTVALDLAAEAFPVHDLDVNAAPPTRMLEDFRYAKRR